MLKTHVYGFSWILTGGPPQNFKSLGQICHCLLSDKGGVKAEVAINQRHIEGVLVQGALVGEVAKMKVIIGLLPAKTGDIQRLGNRFEIDYQVHWRHFQERIALGKDCIMIFLGIGFIQMMCHLPKKCNLILTGLVVLLIMAVPQKGLSYQAADRTHLGNLVKSVLVN